VGVIRGNDDQVAAMGDYAKARIIHLHGPTPYQREFIDSHFSELKDLTGGCYQELCDLWADLLEEAR
jgi:hypothetical protein